MSFCCAGCGYFAIATFNFDFNRPATNLAISGKALIANTGINRHVKCLAAKWALNGCKIFHGQNLVGLA